MIEVIWSPKLTITRRRVNRFSITSRTVSMHDRAATFDGPPHLSLESAANDRVSKELIEMVGSVATHLLKHEHKCVSRLVALFKQDRDCHPWLHFATSIRVEGDQLIGGSIHRLPVNLGTKYLHEGTAVTDDYIDEQRKRNVVLSWRPARPSTGRGDSTPRYRFSANALARNPDSPSTRKDRVAHLRHGTTETKVVGSLPPEIKMLETFLDDAFYALYAARMTMGAKAKPAVLQVPRQLEQFLGTQQLDMLLVSIMQLRRDKAREARLAEQMEKEEEEDMEAAAQDADPESPPLATSATMAQPPERHATDLESEATTFASPKKTTREGKLLPKIYVSTTAELGKATSTHLVPLCTVREQCDQFIAELTEKLM